jgi:hypothetical protein
MARVGGEQGAQLRDGALGLVAVVVEPREQHPYLRIPSQTDRGFEWLQGVGGAPGMHGRHSRALEQPRVVGVRREPLAEEQRRLFRPALRERPPSPRFEAAPDVLAPRGAVRSRSCRLAEPLARVRELTGGVES